MTRTKTRALANTPNNYVSVLDYGADPTGVGDSSEAFENALEEINTVFPRTHDLYVPPGTYRVTRTLYHCYPHTTELVDQPQRENRFATVFGNNAETTKIVWDPRDKDGNPLDQIDFGYVVGSETAYAGVSGYKKGVYHWGLRGITLDGALKVKNTLTIGGAHYGQVENVRVSGGTEKGIYIFGAYDSGGTGSLWNKFYSCHALGPGSAVDGDGNRVYPDSCAWYIGPGANANYFFSPWFNSAQTGIYNGGARNCFYGVSGESQPPNNIGFEIAGQTQIFGIEMENTGGTGTGKCGFQINNNSRSSIYGAKVIGFSKHSEKGPSYPSDAGNPEVSFIDDTYESPDIGNGSLYRNLRWRPPLDALLLPIKYRSLEIPSTTIPESPTWSNDLIPDFSADDVFTERRGYFGTFFKQVIFERDSDQGTTYIQMKSLPYSGSWKAIGSISNGQTGVVFKEEDILDEIMADLGNSGHMQFDPSFRAFHSSGTVNLSGRIIFQTTA